MKTKTAYTGNGPHPKHRFLFNIGGKIKSISTKVRPGKGSFKVLLTEPHVERAIRLNGHGDAANCAGTICTVDHSDVIPHKFTGYCDFWDFRAFLSCRNNAETNLPSHSVCWKHNRPDISKLFDNRAGLQKLLKMLQAGGPIEILFTPPIYRTGSRKGVTSGSNNPLKRKHGRGHNARINRVQNGWSQAA